MFLCDACDQPVSSAWIGSICSRVALEKWSWHPCSPVTPPSSGQCSCWSSSPPAPVHSRLCVTVLPTLRPGAFLVALCSSPVQCDIKLDRRKAISPQRSLCQSSVALFFPWWPFGWIPSPHQHTPTCREISSHPASVWAIFCWRVPFFVVSVTKVLVLRWTLRWTLPYTLIFQQMKERATL